MWKRNTSVIAGKERRREKKIIICSSSLIRAASPSSSPANVVVLSFQPSIVVLSLLHIFVSVIINNTYWSKILFLFFSSSFRRKERNNFNLFLSVCSCHILLEPDCGHEIFIHQWTIINKTSNPASRCSEKKNIVIPLLTFYLEWLTYIRKFQIWGRTPTIIKGKNGVERRRRWKEE